ncbi:DEAD/DEAH box helicase [Acinetobacter baumannii]
MNNLGHYILNEIENSSYFKDLTEKLVKSYSLNIIDNNFSFFLSESDQKDIFRFIDLLANTQSQKARMKAYHLISLLEPFLNNSVQFRIYSSSVYSKLGLYALNLNMEILPFDRRFEVNFKKNIQRINYKYTLTDTQYEIFYKMLKAPHFSFSGPTSLGKSFIMRRYIEKIIEKSDSNIVILVPSKALINQVSNDLKDELGEKLIEKKITILTHGNLINNNKKSNFIFVLTPERLLSLYNRNTDIRIDYLFIDEAHKLSHSSKDDTRSLTAYSAVDKTLDLFENAKLIFASPNISNPEVFLELFGKSAVNSIKVDESPVSQNLYLVDFKYNDISYIYESEKYSIETEILKTVRNANEFILKVGRTNNSNMVYCSSKDKAINSAREFYIKMKDEEVELSESLKDAIEKISSYVHKEYYLSEFLEKRIAYHHGQLPQIIRNIVEKLFRDGEINFIFCTPTLVEGVNMPTKNIFINCDNKVRLSKSNKENNPNKTIAFWNLAGRAGRYCKELSGNIFCIQSDSRERWDDLSIFDKKNNILETTIDKKFNDNKSINDLKRILENDNFIINNNDKTVEFLSNLLSIDTIRFNDNLNQSFLLKKVIDSKREDIIELARIHSKKLAEVPLEVVDSFKALDFNIHHKVYKYIKQDPMNRKFPKLDYDNIQKILFIFYDLYSWEFTEKNNIRSLKQLDYYSSIMNKWVSGKPINIMINEELKRCKEVVVKRGEKPIPFERSNRIHVNIVIDSLLYDIEKILTFTFEKYFNHYYKCLCSILGEENAGHNWSTYLEYGTKNLLEIELQNLGLSRHTAHNIANDQILKSFILIDEKTNEIIGLNKDFLLLFLDEKTVDYDEINAI